MQETGTRKVRINVTKHDIEQGVVANARYCPIARAVQRRLKSPYLATVYEYIVIWPHEDAHHSAARVPNPKASEMYRYDTTGELAPMTFSIELPAEVLK